MSSRRPSAGPRGRAALSRPTGRFEALRREEELADFAHAPQEDAPKPSSERPTRLHAEYAASIVTKNDSPDVPFALGLNPYRGCEHGCIYCYARPGHSYIGHSPGLDFETEIYYKPNAPELLERYLRRRAYVPQTIVIGGNTDAYQPAERRHRITRELLGVMLRFGNPVGLITKSDRILADADLLAQLAARDLVSVAVSLTTLDQDLSRRMEPRAAHPDRRLAAITALARAGVPVTALIAPVVPGLTDDELERLLEAAADAGARSAGYIVLRLPHELSQLFDQWLGANYHTRRDRVIQQIMQMRGGRTNDPRFRARMRGIGIQADLLNHRFQVAARRLGLQTASLKLRTDLFQPPPQSGDQLGLGL